MLNPQGRPIFLASPKIEGPICLGLEILKCGTLLYGDRGVRQLLLGCAHPLVPLLSEEYQIAVQRPFGLPLTVLAGHVGDKIRNHANSALCSVDKYGHKIRAVAGAKGDAT
jgi:hypothetical protein